MTNQISQTTIKNEILKWEQYSLTAKTVADLNVANRKINHFTKLLKPVNKMLTSFEK